MRSKDFAKASGLELRKPQGALAEGHQCGLGREGYNRTGLERGPLMPGKNTSCHCAGFVVYLPFKTDLS